MKVCFLDFDGVLNSHRFMEEEFKLRGTPDGPTGTVGLDSKAVARVSALCERTGAVIVVSSSWRYGHTLPELRQALEKGGLSSSIRVIDTTPLPHDLAPSNFKISFGFRRGDEIDYWLRFLSQAHGTVESFVVLDDDSDIAPHLNRHVKTSFAEGLLDEHVERAEQILGQRWLHD